MRERTRKYAEKIGIIENLRKLENDIMSIDYIIDVDFDIDSFAENWNIRQVIIIPKYNIPFNLINYFDIRSGLVDDILKICKKYGLSRTQDRIEDMGEHLYIVTFTKSNNGKWRTL